MPRCHCRYCYEYGHNKMGCPKAKADANNPANGDGKLSPLAQWDKEVADNNGTTPHLYNVRRKYEWDWKVAEAVEIQLKKRARSRKVKVCNYCNQQGHNKRTCPTLKQHKALILKGEANYRKVAFALLQKVGLGIGATVHGTNSQYVNGQWTDFEGIGLVTDIDYQWFRLTTQHLGFGTRKSQPITIRWSNGATSRHEIPKAFYEECNGIFQTSYYRDDYTLIAPSPAVSPPQSVLGVEDMADVLKEYFKLKANTAYDFVTNSVSGTTNAGKKLADYAGESPTIIEK